jgi:apolipoprotein N-acyltransferase
MAQPHFLRALEPDLSAEDRNKLSLSFARILDYFLEATRREARAGAKIVVWPEANAMVFQDSEAALLTRAQQLAREEEIHLLIGAGVVYPGTAQPFENKAVLIDPAGIIALSYVKAIPVPGFEARLSRRGKRQILTADSPYGNLHACTRILSPVPLFA